MDRKTRLGEWPGPGCGVVGADRGAAIWRTSLGMGSPANVLAVSCLAIANVKNPLTFPPQRGIRRNRFARGCVWLMKT